MIRRLPVVPTLIVAVAAAILVALGFWQLDRARWKHRLIETYQAAEKRPPIAFPATLTADDPPLFRWATGFCLRPVSKRAVAGQNRRGETGYAHVVTCATGAEGPGMAVELGWSTDPNAQWQWSGGPVTGLIVPDRTSRIRLVAASAPAGLQPSAIPSAASASRVTPAGHRGYALTWFALAAAALAIYLLALGKQLRGT